MFESANPTPTASQTYDENPYYVNWVMASGTTPSFGNPGKKLSTENGALYSLMFQIPEDAMSGEYKLSLDTAGRLTNYNFALDTDANGQVIPGDGKTVLSVATNDMTVTVKGVEPVGTPCPEHTDVTTWTEVAENAWTSGALTTGHYKLMGDQATTAAMTVAEGEIVCVDLNGYNLSGNITGAGTLVCADYATADFTVADGKYGSLADACSTLVSSGYLFCQRTAAVLATG